ncbi:MAG TPA: chromosome segregation protein SMC [Firmicutes bacterium]|nr:chromosome segregation protein SMC [Bacillota bacterium]
MFGFKSFAAKTSLEFCNGLSVIVGSNGSGKSNIADAIWWVLGQQNPRLLRVGRAEELIFSGSSTRPPLSVAEVSLVLEDGGEEIELTRRVSRDGENEYFINGSKCRLKDVVSLVSEGNVHPDGFVVIGQGRADEFVVMSPEGRKELLEQVAGVTRYRLRREEALRQLADAEKNLERIADLKAELEARRAELAEAAEKAREYRELHTRLRSLEIAATLDDLCTLRERIAGIEAEARSGRERMEALGKQLADLERALEARGAEKEKLEAELADVLAGLASKRDELNRLSVEVPLAERRISDLENQGRRLESEAAADLKTASELETEAERDAEKAEALLSEARLKEERARNVEENEIPRLRRLRDEKAVGLEARRDELFELLSANANLRNKLTRWRDEIERLTRQASRLQEEVEEAEKKKKQLVEKESQLLSAHKEAASKLDSLLTNLSDMETSVKELKEQRRGLETRKAPLVSELARIKSRRAVLEELAQSFEEFAPGTRAVLKASAEGRLKGIKGAIAEMIRVEPGFEVAVDVALGGALQYIITEDVSAAEAAIQFLKNTNAGRVTFLPRDIVRAFRFSERELALMERFDGVRPLYAVIEIAPEFDNCLRNVAGRVAVAPDVETALALGRRCGFSFKIATITGELFLPGGSLTGGRTKQVGLMQRKAEIRRLDEGASRLKGELEALESQAAELDAGLGELTSRISACRDEITRLQIELNTKESELRQLRLSIAELEKVVEDKRADIKRCTSEVSRLQPELDKLGTALGLGETQEKQLKEAIKTEETEYEAARREVEHYSSICTSLKAEAVSLAREAQSLSERRERLMEEARRLASVAYAKRAEARRVEAERRELIQTLKRHEEDLAKARGETNRLAEREESLRKSIKELEAKLEETNHSYKSLRIVHGKTAASLQAIELELVQRKTEAKSLEEKLGEVPPGTQRIARQLVAEEILSLQKQMEELGQVNPLAEREFRELCDRISTLEAQIEDVNAAKADLYKLVEKIDAEMDRRYVLTAESVRTEFRRIFSQLFEGGEGELVLTDRGVELSVRPPGRKVKGLASLSGGEKAMTGIAALFAMAQVNPSPFHVLDEVDAALDDVNLARFLRYLMNASKRTQFIVITHQRQLMQAANALYGVTVDEPGVSTVVSVKLREVSVV